MSNTTVTFYGASDDLIEVAGAAPGCDEYTANTKLPDGSEGAVFGVGGLIVTVRYTREGVWSIEVAQEDEDVEVAAKVVGLSARPDLCRYSMALTVEIADGLTVTRLDATDEPDPTR